MESAEPSIANALLIVALVLPIVWFLLLRSRLRLAVAAATAVVAGWALNLAWAFTAHESAAIAAAFGWVCPSVLVGLTWLVQRVIRRRAK